MQIPTKYKAILIGLIVACVIAIPTVLAVTYYLTMSDPAQTQVIDTQQPIEPTFTATQTITLGQPTTLTADCGSNWANKLVYFYEVGNTTPLGSATANGSGIATFNTTPTTIGTHNYTAGPPQS